MRRVVTANGGSAKPMKGAFLDLGAEMNVAITFDSTPIMKRTKPRLLISRTVTLLALGMLLSAPASGQGSEVCITQRLTYAWNGGTNIGGDCGYQSISADGRFATFHGPAINLVQGDTNNQDDVFVVNLATLEVDLVSVSDTGNQGNLDSQLASISGDGRYIAFHSFSDNLVVGDTNGVSDVFVRDRQSGTTERVSLDSTGAEGNGKSFKGAISADGRFVAFCSDAANLVTGDLNGVADVFIHDRLTGTTERVTEAVGGGDANTGTGNLTYLWRRLSVNANGRYVAFSSHASNLVSGDSNGWDVFVRDMVGGTTVLASVKTNGVQANSDSYTPQLSANGRYVVFESYANNLVPGDTNGQFDVFRHDLRTGETVRVNTTASGGQSSEEAIRASISPCGQLVAFESRAQDLILGDTNNKTDIYMKDLRDGAIRRVSVGTNGSQPNKNCWIPSVSADGMVVTYSTNATTLGGGDTSDRDNLFARLCGLSGPEPYCTAKVNSQGCTPFIAFTGLPTYTSIDDFLILTFSIVSGKPGVLFWSTTPTDTPFQGGTLCVSAPHQRTATQFSGGSGTPDCTGTFSFPFTQAYMAANGLVVGSVVYAQCIFRDTAHTDGTMTGLTDALQFQILP